MTKKQIKESKVRQRNGEANVPRPPPKGYRWIHRNWFIREKDEMTSFQKAKIRPNMRDSVRDYARNKRKATISYLFCRKI